MPGQRTVGQDQGYYDWSPIIDRKPLKWPGGARVALVVIVNLEHWDWQLPPDVPGAPTGPFRGPIADYSQHEYGNRVGFWRMVEVLDHHKIRPCVCLAGAVLDHCTEIRDAIEHPQAHNVYSGDKNAWDRVPLAWTFSDRSLDSWQRFRRWFDRVAADWEAHLKSVATPATLTVERGVESQLQFKRPPTGS
jgi:hypothetical protein